MATRAAGKVALDEALEAARGLHAEDFLRAQAAPEQTVTAALCALYREGKRREAVKSLSLRSMVVDGMDDEQVFQQMRVLEAPIVDHLERMLRRLDEGTSEAAQLAWAREAKRALRPAAAPARAKAPKPKKETKKAKKEEEKKKAPAQPKKRKEEEEEQQQSDVEGDGIMYKDFFGDDKVDDDDEVNRMLVDEDKQQELEDVLGQHDSDLDLDADISDGDGDELNEVFEEDPFDDSIFETKHDDDEDEDEDEEDENDEEDEEEDKQDEDSENENEEENENDDENDEDGETKKTSHEAEQELIQKRIAKLEDANVGAKPWTLAGEVSVADRPVDSLLDTYVEFQSGTHEPPVVSPAMTAELTQLIQKRVADGTWDDIEPRTLAADAAAAPRAEALSPEEEARRAKMGLGEVYEEEYRRQLERMAAKSGALLKDDAALTPQQTALERELTAICRELDVLANFHFTPEPVEKGARAGTTAADDEVKVLPNAPSIAMEEIVPMAVSSATLLAPEEVYNAKATALRKTPEEMTREERRAAHNAHKREVRRARAATGAAAAEAAAAAAPEAATAGARLKWGSSDGVGRTASSITSSTAPTQRRFRSKAFFAALQHEQATGGAAPAAKKPRAGAGAASAAKL